MAEILSVIEHSSLKVVAERATAQHALGVHHTRLLEKLSPNLPAGTFSWGHQSVRFAQFCGVIQLDDLTLEVLPKIHGKEEQPESCREALVQMLHTARIMRMHKGAQAGINTQQYTLLDIFIQHFCHDLNMQILQGKLRNYIEQEENLSVMRGRLVIPQHIRHNQVHKERLFCRFDEFSEDILLNQILRFTLRLLMPWAGSGKTKKVLTELLMHFDGISDSLITLQSFNLLKSDRITQRFQPVIEQCRLFISAIKPDVLAGSTPLFSLLFDMNRLFEAWVADKLKPWAHQQGWHLRTQGPRKYLAMRDDDSRQFQLRPDIALVDDDNVPQLIADAKWKLLNKEDGKLGVSSSDMYQLYTYAGRYKAPRLRLFYPQQAGLLSHYNFTLQGMHTPMLTVRAVAVSNNQEWNEPL
ncbi:restriction endonuclease [[Pantoea] beijingensis]|uniref:Restriction endonuclease n=1 Tax=[Pantoea] beijingensis TaxID=1324864 RepID=A0A443IBH9_9GAMM|nr:McrC family protein [[Pantoea] beijingensis]RWR01444.1 restriction endonuclease [[Pantoea] beijingensis]